MKKLLLAGLVLLGVALAVYLFPNAAAAQTVPLSGEAWSDVPQTSADRGAGWIRFSGTAQNGSAYGVVANQSSGNLSGYAWSENYGWLSFNLADVSLCPTAPCQPNVNPSTGVVTGWARFISAPAGTADVWNGWVELNPPDVGGPVGVTYNSSTQQFSGYAWGDSDIGWVRFCNSASPAYCVTMPPLVPPEATINITTIPSNATWNITPGNINGTGNGSTIVTPAQSGTTYSVTATPPTPSGYDPNPTITNTQNGGSSALLLPGQTVGFTITYTRSFDYSLSNTGNINVQKAGITQNGQNVVTATLVPGAGSGPGVTLSVSGAPSGVTASISGQNCAPTASTPCNFTITMSVAPSAPSGTYPITVTGQPLSKTTSFNLVIADSPNIIVSCNATPSTAQVGNDVTWSISFVNNPNPNPRYTYSWSGTGIASPPDNPTGQSFVISYSTTGVKQATATVWDSLNNQAICPTGYITIGANPDYGEF